jgi:hypothetical protein
MKFALPSLILALLFETSLLQAASLRVAAFSCDATPPLGEPMIWATKLEKVVTPLLAKGVVLADGTNRFVLCSFDWCLICNESEQNFCETLTRAASTLPSPVSVHSVHQHAAPYADEGAHRLLDAASNSPSHLSANFLKEFRARLASAASEAVKRLEVFDRIGTGQGKVERVASARRIHDANGRLLIRFSTGALDRVMADAPEGDIDPMLKTITFAHGDKTLVRLHFYATHPQTFCCDGRASADFIGEAREDLEKAEHVPQIYFTGCAGDVTVGKYNDGSLEAYVGLKHRFGDGLKASIAATRFEPATNILWRDDAVSFPLRDEKAKIVAESRAWLNDMKQPDTLRVFKGAMRLAFVERAERPVEVSALQLGGVWIVNLPGEPMLSFQRFTQGLRAKNFVAVAGYADCGPSYICTEQAIGEGGYEPASSNVGRGSEQALREAIQRLLAGDSEAGAKKIVIELN